MTVYTVRQRFLGKFRVTVCAIGSLVAKIMSDRVHGQTALCEDLSRPCARSDSVLRRSPVTVYTVTQRFAKICVFGHTRLSEDLA